MPSDQRDDTPTPEFGPGGYLPERAAKRARKIVLRAPLGLQWIVASVVAGLLVVVAGVLFLARSGDAPGPPWVEAGPVDELPAAGYDPDLEVLVVATGGRVRAFAGAQDVVYCPATNQLEAPDGRVWAVTGRGRGGTPSLAEHPTFVQDGIAYVDPTRVGEGPSPSQEPADAGCPPGTV
jgi:hypothetical protein